MSEAHPSAEASGDVGLAPASSRIETIREALGRAEPWLTREEVDRARGALAEAERRLALVGPHTVVALVGGTGSGKSSLFNAISELTIADVGERRPTTALPTACVWRHDAKYLLDHLGIPAERRARGEAALTASRPGELDDVVLIDVPDHDSVVAGHREHVDRLLPLVDLMVWVLDPQKYADHRVHSEYLSRLEARQDAMLVLVNQVDTLTPAGREAVLADVTRVLAREGLGEVRVQAVSARTGEGVPAVRALVHDVAQGSSRSERTAAAHLASITGDLRSWLGEADRCDLEIESVVEALAAAAGVGACADALAAAVRGEGVAPAGVRPPAVQRVESLHEEWLQRASAGLTPAWRTSLEEAVASSGELAEAAEQALRAVALPPVDQPGPLAFLRRARLEKEGAEVAAAYRRAAHEALTTAVTSRLRTPAQAVLSEWHAIRALLSGA